MHHTLFKNLENAFWSFVSLDHYQDQHLHAYSSSVTAVSGFNLLYLHHGATLEALEKALAWYQEKGQDALIVCEKGDASALIAAQKERLHLVEEAPTTAMILDLQTWKPLSNRAQNYLIEAVQAPLDDWSKPLSTAFSDGESELSELDLEVTKQYQAAHEMALTNGAPIHHFVMKVAGIPVCNLSLTLTEDGARFDDIGTDIQQQGKGYATTLIQHALLFAKEQDATIAVLESSNEGLSIYQKLGFETLFEYEAFVWEHQS